MSASVSNTRRFVLVRKSDVSGTSGTGIVAEGIEFSNGQVALHWLSQLECVAVYSNIRTLEAVHGHGNATAVEWIDEEKTTTATPRTQQDEATKCPCGRTFGHSRASGCAWANGAWDPLGPNRIWR